MNNTDKTVIAGAASAAGIDGAVAVGGAPAVAAIVAAASTGTPIAALTVIAVLGWGIASTAIVVIGSVVLHRCQKSKDTGRGTRMRHRQPPASHTPRGARTFARGRKELEREEFLHIRNRLRPSRIFVLKPLTGVRQRGQQSETRTSIVG